MNPDRERGLPTSWRGEVLMCMTERRVTRAATDRAVCSPARPAAGHHFDRAKLEPGRERPARILVVDDNVDLARGWRGCSRSTVTTCGSPTTDPPASTRPRNRSPTSFSSTSDCRAWTVINWPPVFARDETVKDATLIAISGYGQEEDLRLAKEAGFDHHLVKPIVSDELIKLLEGI